MGPVRCHLDEAVPFKDQDDGRRQDVLGRLAGAIAIAIAIAAADVPRADVGPAIRQCRM